MQIVREGCGTKIQDGKTRQVATRFTETNLSNGNVLSNTSAEFAYITEIFLAMKLSSLSSSLAVVLTLP